VNLGHRVRSDQKGLAGVLFIFVSIWAFSALGMLLGIYYTARNVESNVEFITRDIGEIKGETTLANLLVETNRLADEIKGKVAPLSPLLDQIIPLATNIKENVDLRITPGALSIGSTLQGVSATVDSITGNADAINRTLVTVGNQAVEIRDLVNNIGRNVTDATNRAGAIEGLVDTASGQATTIAGLLETIYNDHVHPSAVLVGGPGNAGHRKPDGALTIHGYANDIDCLVQGSPTIFFNPPSSGAASPFSRASLMTLIPVSRAC
jgi:methyl-accepting chemotaxis protein